MAKITMTYLSGMDISALEMTNEEIVGAVETGLAASGRGQTVIEPRMHLTPDPAFGGHFNVLRGYIAPLDLAGVKIVGDYVDNYTKGLPSEMALLNLFDPRTGMPKAVLDATAITEMRTGAVTAIGAKYLAPERPRVLGHIGARGTAYWNVRLLDHLFDFDEIRVHSRRPESRDAFAARLTTDLGKPVFATPDWESCLNGADILVEASRLMAPEPLFKREWVAKGSLVIPYGTMSTLPLGFTSGIDKFVMDDIGQMHAGHLGALRPHIDAGLITEQSFYAEIGEIAAGNKLGRTGSDETILFWHRGLATSDIALGAAMLGKAAERGIGTVLPYA